MAKKSVTIRCTKGVDQLSSHAYKFSDGYARGNMKPQQNSEIYNAHALLKDLKTCSIRRDLEWGRRLHAKAVEGGNHANVHVLTGLIKMYSNCGRIADARRLFDSIQKPDVVCWNAVILGHADNGKGRVALDLFSRMKAAGCTPNSITYVGAIKACASLAVIGDVQDCLQRGREIHSQIGSSMNRCVQNTLIHMYSRCKSMVEARRVFDCIQEPDVVSCTALLLGYADNGEGQVSLDLFSWMKARGCAVDSVVYVAAVKACTSLALTGDAAAKADCLERGRQLHSEVGTHVNHYVQSALIDMYVKCGSMSEARCLFDGIKMPGVVSWNALIMGYAENGEERVALELYNRMKASGCMPNSVTYMACLKACTSLVADGDEREKCLEVGREMHSEIGCHLNRQVQNTLIDMYSNCRSMVEARRVFDGIGNPDVVSWNALIMGYAENGDGLTALDLIDRMKARGCTPDSVTYVAALKACSLIGALDRGREFHSQIREFNNTNVVTTLVDFYAKCGSMLEAREVFDLHSGARSVSTWNALLAGYASSGDSTSAFEAFEAMQDKGFRPNGITFVSMLSCCSHGGLVEKAWEFFEAMPVQYGVNPSVMHYTCMVDVLGRANKLNEAIALLRKMPCNVDEVTWRVLLDACRKWKCVEIGRLAFQALVDMDKKDSSAYLLMAHIYGSRGMRSRKQCYKQVP